MEIPPLPALEWIGSQAIFSQPHADFIATLVTQGYSLRASSGAANIPYRAVAQWVECNAEFRLRVETAAARRVFFLEHRLLSTEDPVQAKTLMQALRRAAPETWADPRESPSDVSTAPQTITMTIVEPTPRPLPKFIEAGILQNAPSSEKMN